jgi:hypothetical protein
LKDALEARRGGGAEKGLAVDGVRQNRLREDRQNCKKKKKHTHTHKINRKKQYREILKQIQGNPTKQNTKKNQNKK